jgi:uncharacterized protein with FMN-binding domain
MKKTIIGIVVAVIVVGIVLLLPKKAAVPVTEETSGATTSTNTATTTTAAPMISAYKDGTYSATGSYISPGGPDNVTVSVTLANGIITDATVTSGAHDPTSSHYQGIFIANYKPLVIGKNIDDVVLSKVSGSSLTSGGFNDALTQIKAEATA